MPSRQIVESDQNGTPVYTFADADNCRCLYVGGQKEYAKLQELRQQRIDDHNQLARRSSFEAAFQTSGARGNRKAWWRNERNHEYES